MVKKKSTRVAYGKTLAQLGEENEDIVVLDADLSKSTKTFFFAEKFPERFFDMGVSEQDMMCTAAGLATCGKIAFASTFAIFASLRDLDQVRNTVAFSNLNVKLVASHGGLSVGADGTSHQIFEDIGIMRGIPNMRVIVPADAVETEKAIRRVAKEKGPFFVRLTRPKIPVLFDQDYQFRIGKSSTVKEGDKVSLLATGLLVHEALEAAEILEKEGIDTEVVNISSIKPIDREKVIQSAEKAEVLLTCEEHNIYNGLGSAVAEILAEKSINIKFRRVGMRDVFGQSGQPKRLFQHYGLDSRSIVKKAEELLEKE